MRRIRVSNTAAALAACLLCAACGKEERASDANDLIETREEKSNEIRLRANEQQCR